jgi:hydroxyquinol 1,2-dioxygenase
MRNFNENTITDAVLDRITDAGQPRIRQVSEALVRHLHAFVREVRPTQREWEQGIEFLTRTGHMCDDKRQEFILLSDTLGVSMLVDAINHGAERRDGHDGARAVLRPGSPGEKAWRRHLRRHGG